MARPIRIVVGEGRTAQRGLLRFVLEGEGFEVVGEAHGSADLPAAIEAHHPDVVVLDDGIGVMAVSMVHEVAPQAKVVLVWPAAVVPIGGDARVEPAKILRDLGPAVEHVAAASVALTESFDRPEWIDKVRKDPATLRRKLLAGGAVAMRRPSVTRLQRGGKRLHPRRGKDTDMERQGDREPAPVVVLPAAAAGAASEPILDLVGAGAASAAGAFDERSEWNRRLGTLALSGAAAVSALVLALALGGGSVSVSVLRGTGQLPPGVPGFVQGATTAGVAGPFGVGTLGGAGYDPIGSSQTNDAAADGGSGSGVVDGGGGGQSDAVDSFDGGDLLAPDFAGGSGAETPPEPVDVDPGNDPGGNGGGGNGGGGVATPDSSMPGRSAAHNPHGGPPSKLGLTPAHGPGLGNGAAKAEPAGHAHKN
jgi:CheY-like chemotaxis protein